MSARVGRFELVAVFLGLVLALGLFSPARAIPGDNTEIVGGNEAPAHEYPIS